ncbi:MAG: hypothetical protein LC664_05390 [Flavobacteriales bacterium]|nr:hypothetical protein [Flavobacteriales bacterium]
MKILKNSLFVMIAFAMVSCGGAEKSETNTSTDISKAERIYNEAIEIHDEIMPKMGKLGSLQKDLEDLKAVHPEDSVKINEHISKLENASESMMLWMRELKQYPQGGQQQGRDKHSSKADTSYALHAKQKSEIETVQDDMNMAIEEAKVLLEGMQ